MRPVCYRGQAIPETSVGDLTDDSFLGSVGFGSLWTVRGGRRVVWAVEDGGQLIGVLPGVEFGRWPVRRFLAQPNGLYGKVSVRSGEEERSAEIGFELMRAVLTGGYCKVDIYDFYQDALPLDGPFQSATVYTTLVDVSDPEWEPPDRKLRGEIRKAGRETVTIEKLDWKSHGGGFMSLVRRMGGDQKYPEAFWRKLASVAAEDDRVRWYYCERDSKPVSSHVYFIEGTMLLGWQMYYDRAFSALKANPFTIVHAVQEARARGVRTLNLGATPQDAGGTSFFKERWGGEAYGYRVLVQRRGIGRVL